MWNPLSWVMEAAAIMAIALANGRVRLLFALFLISSLLCSSFFFLGYFLINSTISIIEEDNVGDATTAIIACLTPKSR